MDAPDLPVAIADVAGRPSGNPARAWRHWSIGFTTYLSTRAAAAIDAATARHGKANTVPIAFGVTAVVSIARTATTGQCTR
jgi:hypothetical protein